MQIDGVEIHWPDGKIESPHLHAVNRIITVEEDKSVTGELPGAGNVAHRQSPTRGNRNQVLQFPILPACPALSLAKVSSARDEVRLLTAHASGMLLWGIP
jgi:hypothetical protein